MGYVWVTLDGRKYRGDTLEIAVEKAAKAAFLAGYFTGDSITVEYRGEPLQVYRDGECFYAMLADQRKLERRAGPIGVKRRFRRKLQHVTKDLLRPIGNSEGSMKARKLWRQYYKPRPVRNRDGTLPA